MIKLLTATAVALATSVSVVSAQTSTPATPSTTTPSATPQTATPPKATTGNPSATTAPGAPIGSATGAASGATTGTQATTTGSQMWYTPTNNEMRASRLIGTNVRNSGGETIGEINEILLDSSGKVAAVVVGVGGFLGLGEREVAISYSSLQMTRDNNGTNVVTVNATRDLLKGAPAWTAPRT